MSINLLHFVAKTINFIIISIVSIIGNYNKVVVDNKEIKTVNVVNQVVEHETIIKYNSKIPYNTKNILVEGVDGIVYELDGEQKVLREKIDEVIEIGTGAYGEYRGVLTSYGPDCAGCDKNGYTYCKTKEGTWHSLIKDSIYYNDSEYGKVRILASDHRKFPCGTIIEINNNDQNSIIGIVLDTGSAMINALNNGWNLIDLAYESQNNIPFGTNQNTTFSVKRWGW